MSEGGMLYLILIVASFLCLVSALMYAMLESGGRRDEPRRTEAPQPSDHAHGDWSRGGAG